MKFQNNILKEINKERRKSVSNSVNLFDSDFEEMIASYRSLISKINLSFRNFLLKLNLNKNTIEQEQPNILTKITKEVEVFEKNEDQLYSIIKKHLKFEKSKKEKVNLKKKFMRRQTMTPSLINKAFKTSFKSYLDPRSTSLSKLESSNFSNPKKNLMSSQLTMELDSNSILPIKKSETPFGFKSNIRSEFGNNFEMNNDNSSLSNNKSNKSEFGDISRKYNEDLKSIKSDVTRQNQEIKMLNKEINLLKKQLVQQTRNSQFLNEKLKKFGLKEEKVKNKIIHNLKFNLKETEKKINDLTMREAKSRKSLLINNNISQLGKKSQSDVMKLGLKNVMKEKKDLQKQLDSYKEELKLLQFQYDDLKKKIDQKNKKIKEVEHANEELTNKFIITVHRETNLTTKIEKLMSKLRAYEKYFNEVKKNSSN